jgi:hypothetical protein
LGDYNQNDVVDAADYVLWRSKVGTMGIAPYSGADGSGNGSIGTEDYGVWRAHFGQTLPSSGTGSGLGGATASAAHVALVGEPTGAATSVSLHPDEPDQTITMPRTDRKEQAADQRQDVSSILILASQPLAAYRRPLGRSAEARPSFAASRTDDTLLAWSASQLATKKQLVETEPGSCSSVDAISKNDIYVDSVEQAFALLSSDQVGCLAWRLHDLRASVT